MNREARNELKARARRMLTVEGLTCKATAQKLRKPYWMVHGWLADDDPSTEWYSPPSVTAMVSGVKATKCRALKKLGFSIREISRVLGYSASWVHHLLTNVKPMGDPTLTIKLKESVQDIEGRKLMTGSTYRCFLHNRDHLIMQRVADNALYFVRYEKLLNRVEVSESGKSK